MLASSTTPRYGECGKSNEIGLEYYLMFFFDPIQKLLEYARSEMGFRV